MSVSVDYRLLQAFQSAFEDKPYLHRNSSIGNSIAVHLYEDLYCLSRSKKFSKGIREKSRAVNLGGTLTGISLRRGDGTFGQRNPSTAAIEAPGFAVARSQLATTEIGVEVKILAKAMIKQIARVDSDLREQVAHFKRGGSDAISVAIVGINHAETYVSFEGSRTFPTDGRHYKHPFQEAVAAEQRLVQNTKPFFDEFLILRFKATNQEPYLFEWLNPTKVLQEYGAVLARIATKYDKLF